LIRKHETRILPRRISITGAWSLLILFPATLNAKQIVRTKTRGKEMYWMLIQGEAENALQAQLARYALYPLGNSNR
jgi:hypothetical protein